MPWGCPVGAVRVHATGSKLVEAGCTAPLFFSFIFPTPSTKSTVPSSKSVSLTKLHQQKREKAKSKNTEKGYKPDSVIDRHLSMRPTRGMRVERPNPCLTLLRMWVTKPVYHCTAGELLPHLSILALLA